MLGFLFKTSQDSEKSFTSELDTANFRIVQLEKKINELTFTLDTLWELIAEQSSFDSNALQEEISAKKNALEARANETINCSSCNRTVPANKNTCYYCGAKLN